MEDEEGIVDNEANEFEATEIEISNENDEGGEENG